MTKHQRAFDLPCLVCDRKVAAKDRVEVRSTRPGSVGAVGVMHLACAQKQPRMIIHTDDETKK